MRKRQRLVILSCALVAFAASVINSTDAAQQTSIHLRVTETSREDTPDPVEPTEPPEPTEPTEPVETPKPSDPAETSTPVVTATPTAARYVKVMLETCKTIVYRAWYLYSIDSACFVTHAGAVPKYSFYYEVDGGEYIITKCGCNGYGEGARFDVNIAGPPLPRHGNVQCFAKDTSRSLQEILSVFKRIRLLCYSRDFP